MCPRRRKPSEVDVESDVGPVDFESDDVGSDASDDESDSSKESDTSEESDASDDESDSSEESDTSEESDDSEDAEESDDSEVADAAQRSQQQESVDEVYAMESEESDDSEEVDAVESEEVAGLGVAREAIEAQPIKQSEQPIYEEGTVEALQTVRPPSNLYDLKNTTTANSAVTIQPTQAGLGLESQKSHEQQPNVEAVAIQANSRVAVQPAQATNSLTTFNLNFQNYLNDFGWINDEEGITIQAQNNNQEQKNGEEDNGIQARTISRQSQDGPPEQGVAGRRMRLQVSSIDSVIDHKGSVLRLLRSVASSCCNELHTTFFEVQLGGMKGWSGSDCGRMSAGIGESEGDTKGSTSAESYYLDAVPKILLDVYGSSLSPTPRLPLLTSLVNLLLGFVRSCLHS